MYNKISFILVTHNKIIRILPENIPHWKSKLFAKVKVIIFFFFNFTGKDKHNLETQKIRWPVLSSIPFDVSQLRPPTNNFLKKKKESQFSNIVFLWQYKFWPGIISIHVLKTNCFLHLFIILLFSFLHKLWTKLLFTLHAWLPFKFKMRKFLTSWHSDLRVPVKF